MQCYFTNYFLLLGTEILFSFAPQDFNDTRKCKTFLFSDASWSDIDDIPNHHGVKVAAIGLLDSVWFIGGMGIENSRLIARAM
jgi:hypothetical protein